jgi:tetratricopeptide (TPR) repeat protein
MSQIKSLLALVVLTTLLLGTGSGFAQESLFDTMYDAGAQALLERRYTEAEKKLKAALREAEQFEASDARLQKSLKTLAEVYDEEKKFDQSEPLYRRLLLNDEKNAGVSKLTHAGDYNKLASNLQSQGKYEEAISLYLKANDLFARCGTEKVDEAPMWPDENRVVCLIKLSSAYSELGQSSECEKYLREALSCSEAGKDPLAIGRALDALGRHYTGQGRYDEAEAVLERAVSEKKKLQSVANRRLETSNSLICFGRLFHAQGKIKDALAMIDTAYKMRESSLQDTDPRIYEPLMERASIYRDLSCYKEAVAELEKGRALVEKSFGDENPRYAEFLRQLAGDYVSCSQYAKADPLLRKALTIDESAYGKESSEVCLDLNALGMYFIYQGKYADAEPVYKRSLTIAEARLGANHLDVAAALNNLAWLYVNQRKFAEARPLIERGLAIRQKALGEEHPVYARNLHNLANLDISEKRFDEAQQLLERALKIQKAVLGPEHQDTVATMRDLAELLHQSKKYSEAEDLYKAILKADEGLDDTNRAIIAADADNVARSLIDQNRGDEAKPFIDQAKQIKAQLPGYNDAGEGHAISIGTLKPTISAPLKPVADKWALVVGISNFKDPAINLQFAAKDAMDFRNYLIFEANFKPDHVKLLTDQNATRDAIVGHLGDRWLRKVAGTDDLVVVYISSHGTSARKEIGDANFIVAYETNMSNAVLSGIPMQFFTTGIKDLIDCDRVVIIMDVCHGGALRERTLAAAIGGSEEKVQKGSKALVRNPDMFIRTAPSGGTADGGLQIGSGQIVVASSEADQVSWESKLYPNGVFTRQLIESLRAKGEHTSIQQAYRTMRGRVEQEVLRSRAEIQTPIMVSHSWHGGDVYLSVKPAAPRAVGSETHAAGSSPSSAKKPGTAR